MNTETKNPVGRPQATIKFPRGAFTIAELNELNDKLCALTIRNHVKNGVENGELTKMNKTKPSGRRPSFLYIRTKTLQASLANLSKAKQSAPTVESASTEQPNSEQAIETPVTQSEVDVPTAEAVAA